MSETVPTIDDELTELLEAVANRELTPDQHKRLAERLEASADARAAFIQATAFDAMLSHEFPASEPHVATSAMEIPETELKQSSKTFDRPRRTRLGYVMLVAAMATAASLAIVFLRPSEPSAPIAKIAYQSNARWANQQRSQGDAIGTGVLRLDVGIARLDFANGATVTLQGPAQFEILSADRTRLNHGILTAHIPESAIGFEVLTPSLDVVDLGTAFGVTVGVDGETDVCVFEGAVEVSLSARDETPQLVREGNAVRSRPEADSIDPVSYSTERYEDAWPVTSGVLQATGLMKFVSPGPEFVPGKYEDSGHILVFPERSHVLLKSDLEVNVTDPGQYTRVRRRDKQPIAAGQLIRSYLLQLNPIGEFTRAESDEARVIGQITFDRPILGLIGKTNLLTETDEVLGHPLGIYGNTRRGIEPLRPEHQPDAGRDIVTLSSDRRSLSLDLSASSAVDQIRVIVAESAVPRP